jgi:hypothetical protein
MAESLVQVTEGTGKKLHTNSRVIGVNTVEDEYVLPGEYALASYTLIANNISVATANDHILQIMAGASLNVRIREIRIEQNANATTAQRCDFQLVRLTSAGTGGTAATARPVDSADAAAGATGMTLPTVKGTETVVIEESILIMRQAIAATQTQPEETILWAPPPGFKSYIIPAGAANGLAVKSASACPGGTVTVVIKFVETSFAS